MGGGEMSKFVFPLAALGFLLIFIVAFSVEGGTYYTFSSLAVAAVLTILSIGGK